MKKFSALRFALVCASVVPVAVAANIVSAPSGYQGPPPASANVKTQPHSRATPRFSNERGFYDAPFTLTITTDVADAAIRYTSDGTIPSANAGAAYTAPLAIARTTIIRAAAFRGGELQGETVTHSYIFVDDVIRQSQGGEPPEGWPARWGKNRVDYGMDPQVVNDTAYSKTIKDDLRTIPSFSIVMDLKDLLDSVTGIYSNPGEDGSDWERPASVELIYPDGTKGFQINCGIRIRGGFSRSTENAKHSFGLFFKEKYGAKQLNYPLFGEKGADKFDHLDLRTAQNYSWSLRGDARTTFLADQFSRDLQLAMGHQAERGNFYHLYINGQYWGLFNTRERPEASYAATYFGGVENDYDVVKVSDDYTVEADQGDLEAWRRLWSAAARGFAKDADYYSVQGLNANGLPDSTQENLLDVENLIDYMLIILYGGNLDAPISHFHNNDAPNNFYAIRERSGKKGGFKFVIHDAEHTLLDVNSDRTGIVDGHPGRIDTGWTAGNPQTQLGGDSAAFLRSNPQYIWFRLQENAEFRLRVADRAHRHFFNDGVLTPEATRARYLARKKEIDRAVVGESARWGDAQRDSAQQPLTRNVEWVQAIDSVTNVFLQRRSRVVMQQLRADSLYPALEAPSFSQHGGEIRSGFALSMSAPAGRIYYTRDGSDPRIRGGAVSPAALVYSGAVPLSEGVKIRARVLSNGSWSAMNEAVFSTALPPQRYNFGLRMEPMTP